MFICGSPETVRQTLQHHQKDIGFNVLVAMMQIGSMPGELTRKSMTLFAREGDAEAARPGRRRQLRRSPPPSDVFHVVMAGLDPVKPGNDDLDRTRRPSCCMQVRHLES